MRRCPIPGLTPLPKDRRTESPESPVEPLPSEVDEEEGAMEAEDRYLEWLQGRDR